MHFFFGGGGGRALVSSFMTLLLPLTPRTTTHRLDKGDGHLTAVAHVHSVRVRKYLGSNLYFLLRKETQRPCVVE